MNYEKSGIILFKKKDNKYYFLLGKNNLKMLNVKNNNFSDIGGLKGDNDFNSKDTASRAFYENTFGLTLNIEQLSDKVISSFDNKKYNHSIHFVKADIDDSTLNNINKVRSYLNTVIQQNSFNTLEKKDITLQGYDITNDIRWFELNEILNNSAIFDSQFMNTFLKSLKSDILKKN